MTKSEIKQMIILGIADRITEKAEDYKSYCEMDCYVRGEFDFELNCDVILSKSIVRGVKKELGNNYSITNVSFPQSKIFYTVNW